MALFRQQNDLAAAVEELRRQGLTDSVIIDELTSQGYTLDQINSALHQEGEEPPQPLRKAPPLYQEALYATPSSAPAAAQEYLPPQGAEGEGNIYERIEEIAESIIDEKWDELLIEVRKIVDWKEKMEAKQSKMMQDLNKLKEDFMALHQGVLGRLESYDERMQDVGTELQAVGKVFKDVVPEFVENVKELSRWKEEIKKKK